MHNSSRFFAVLMWGQLGLIMASPMSCGEDVPKHHLSSSSCWPVAGVQVLSDADPTIFIISISIQYRKDAPVALVHVGRRTNTVIKISKFQLMTLVLTSQIAINDMIVPIFTSAMTGAHCDPGPIASDYVDINDDAAISFIIPNSWMLNSKLERHVPFSGRAFVKGTLGVRSDTGQFRDVRVDSTCPLCVRMY